MDFWRAPQHAESHTVMGPLCECTSQNPDDLVQIELGRSVEAVSAGMRNS